MKKKPTKQRRAQEEEAAGKLPSSLQRRVGKQVATIINRVLPGLSTRQLEAIAVFVERQLEARAVRGDVEAREAMLLKDALSLDTLQIKKRFQPEYYEMIEKYRRQLFPDRPRQLRGRAWERPSHPTMIAYVLCYRLGTLKMEYDLSLPPFSRATWKQWLPVLRDVFEYQYGEDFENHFYFQRYWRKGQQHERVKRGEVRDAIWKDIKQSIELIAPKTQTDSGTKGE